MKTGEEFKWDPRSRQPVQIGGRMYNFLRGAAHIVPMAEMCIKNLLHLPGVYGRYAAYKKKSAVRTLSDSCTGLAVSWDRDNSEHLFKACRELKPGSVLVRVLSWEEDTYRDVREFVQGLDFRRDTVVIAVIQDRECVKHPGLWKERFSRILELFSPCARYFQIGQAPNRKKWGIRSPREYIRMCRDAYELKTEEVEFIGPSVIDFELNYMDMLLSSISTEWLQVVNSLLYVDRRGMPENMQWPSFDLSNKIRAVRAVADRCGFDEMPLWVTETNWPIQGTGRSSPAGRAVRISEEKYADYLSRYFLLAFATGIPDRIFWWELCAAGYGLVDPSDGGFRKRSGYYAFKTAASLLPGSETGGCVCRDGLYITRFRKDGGTVFAVWNTQKRMDYEPQAEPERVTSYTGEELAYNGSMEVSGSPVFIHYRSGVDIEEAFTS